MAQDAVHRDVASNLVLESWGSVLITVWNGPANLSALDAMERAEHELIAAHGRISTINIAPSSSAGPVDERARERAAALARSVQEHLICTAIVLETDGFAGAIHRAFVSGVMTLSGLATPYMVFKNTRSARAWVASHPDQLPSVRGRAENLEAVIRSMRLESDTVPAFSLS